MTKLDIVHAALKKTLKTHKKKFDHFLPGWYGWEKWFQVELAYELANKGEVYVEKQCAYHKSKKLPVGKLKNSNAFIDVIFRKNNDTQGYFSAIELTVGRTQQNLRKILSDLIKIKALKNSEWIFRSVFVVLAIDSNLDVNNKFSKLFDILKEEYDCREVICGGFTFLLFGWEPDNRISNMSNAKYSDWLKRLFKIYGEYDIKPKISSKKMIKK